MYQELQLQMKFQWQHGDRRHRVHRRGHRQGVGRHGHAADRHRPDESGSAARERDRHHGAADHGHQCLAGDLRRRFQAADATLRHHGVHRDRRHLLARGAVLIHVPSRDHRE